MNKNRILLRDRYFESAIMICITNIDGKDYFILEKRAKNIRQAGEISFPGGKKDKKDKNFRETAIRETLEELQIKRKAITNISKFGILVAATGVIIECYLCKLNIKSLDEINYNKDEQTLFKRRHLCSQDTCEKCLSSIKATFSIGSSTPSIAGTSTPKISAIFTMVG